MKHEWRKHEKELYLPKDKPTLITVPKQKFFFIKGKGDPNGDDFAERVGVLYSIAYAVRMMPKQGYTPDGYFEYTVYPLEGIWDLTEEGRKLDVIKKDELIYTLMIRQPDFVTNEVIERAFNHVEKKKPHPLLKDVTFGTMEEGLSIQIMHHGSYDDEGISFNKMKDYIESNGLEILSLVHREIYISDAREVEKDKLKTVLRYRIRKVE
ncbi:GyrI-like domain-containing protein [Clostridium paraputrificum]|uniref:GyrI-like domain-containing protein n=1 Tax=Clostridium paraputrificum TaxID=29363 RepID=UPI003D33BA57